MSEPMQITIYTDGACDIHADNQPGGWAAILRATDDNGELRKETVLRGGQEMTTNNQMELMAVIAGLKALKHPTDLTIATDSRYVIDIASGRKQSRKNAALWQEYFTLASRHKIKWLHIEGHTGHPYNERCDRIAVAEKNRLTKDDSPPSQPHSPPDSAVNIYLSTRYSSAKATSAWATVTVTSDRAEEHSEALRRTSELEATLIAARKTLQAIPADQSVTIFTAQEYLANGMNLWLANWMAKGWKTKSGGRVKHRRHWQALARLNQERRLSWIFVKHRGDHPHFSRGLELAESALNKAI